MKPGLLFLLTTPLWLGFGAARAASDDGTDYSAPTIGVMQVTPDQTQQKKKKPVNIKIAAPTLNLGMHTSGLTSFPTQPVKAKPEVVSASPRPAERPAPAPEHKPEPKPKPEPESGGRGPVFGGPTPVPVHIVPPQYPRSAAATRPKGYVVVIFTVTASGRTADIEVANSSPPRVFDDAAVDAVRQWRFQPYRANGKPASVRVKQRILFSP